MDVHGEKIPDSDLPHSQIGSSRKGTYTQARTWGYDSEGNLVPKKDIDFTDHNRPSLHPNPHQHRYIPNSTGGTMERSKVAEPISFDEDNLQTLDDLIRPKF